MTDLREGLYDVLIGVNLLLDDADFVSAVLLAVYAVFIILTAYVIYTI